MSPRHTVEQVCVTRCTQSHTSFRAQIKFCLHFMHFSPFWRIGYGMQSKGFKTQNFQTYVGAHQASYSMGTEILFWMVKRSGRSVDLSVSSIDKVKNGWISTSKAPIHPHSMDKYKCTSTLGKNQYRRCPQKCTVSLSQADTSLSPFLSVLSAFIRFICFNPI